MRDTLALFVMCMIAIMAFDPQWVGEWSGKVYKEFLMEVME